jgi:NADPH2:quinone reductase
MTFDAYRIFEENGKAQGRVVQMNLDDLSPGEVVIRAAYSGVNYKDALAGTGAGKILRRFPLNGGIDVSGTVESSGDPNIRPGDEVLVTGHDMSVAHDGGYAEYVRVPASWVVPVPAPLTLMDAMVIGTAGFTAALSVLDLERNGLAPGTGPVIVTGATGGVGSVAVALLAAAGHSVTAVTGKDSEHAYLRSLGAADVLPRSAVQPDSRPLGKATWAGAVDPVGAATIPWLLRTMMPGGGIAASGLAGGTELHTTVLPFILRGVRLLGIDSVMAPAEARRQAWSRLAASLKPDVLQTIASDTIRLSDLPAAFDTLLQGKARGRIVVNLKR